MTSKTTLSRGRWTFSNGLGVVFSNNFQLLLDGKINNYEHHNESRWDYIDRDIVLYDLEGRASARLTLLEDTENTVYQGAFLKDPSGQTTHILSRPKPRASVGCFFRTHFWDDAVNRAYQNLQRAWPEDVIVAADQSNPFTIPSHIAQLPHRQSDFAKLGLLIYPDPAQFLWHMGDYPLYSIFLQTDFDYIIMFEYDAVVNDIALRPFVNMIMSDNADCVGHGFQKMSEQAFWYAQQAAWTKNEFTARGKKEEINAFWLFFPVIFISRSAAMYLLSRRIQTSHFSETGQVTAIPPFCETFVPTELVDAGFEVAKLADYADFYIDLSTNAKSWREQETLGPSIVHPVLSGERFKKNIIAQSYRRDKTPAEIRDWLATQTKREMDDQERMLLLEAIQR